MADVPLLSNDQFESFRRKFNVLEFVEKKQDQVLQIVCCAERPKMFRRRNDL
jgi:hypothetical protein